MTLPRPTKAERLKAAKANLRAVEKECKYLLQVVCQRNYYTLVEAYSKLRAIEAEPDDTGARKEGT